VHVDTAVGQRTRRRCVELKSDVSAFLDERVQVAVHVEWLHFCPQDSVPQLSGAGDEVDGEHGIATWFQELGHVG
jgi:hypothetical protein